MTKTKFYTIGEEIFNSVSHGVGSLISIAACVLMIIKSALSGSGISIVCSAIFGASLIILYTMSTLYHALTNPTAKAVMRIFDHASIFILIAGTYTPFTLVAMGGAAGWTLFGIQWGVTILGIVMNAISLEKSSKVSMILYILLGWCVVFAIKPVVAHIGLYGSLLLLAGGIFYTVGIIFYSLNKIKYMHSIWHLFVLLGSVCHILCILFFVI